MSETAYDVERVRAHFPQLRAGEGLGAAHFDGPGGSQTPDVVAQAVYDVLAGPLANRGDVTPAERNAERAVTAGRAAMADLLAADPRGIVFGRSMTQLTMDLARTLAQGWGPGDEVVVTRLDHDSNVRSWVIAAERAGATVRWVDFDPETAELDVAVRRSCRSRTRLVAVTAASNLLGTMPDVRRSPTSPTRRAPWSTSTACTTRPTTWSTWRRSAPTSTPARPTSSSGRTAACSPPGRSCSSRCTPTSSCPSG